MTQFNLKEWLQDKSRKVVTRDGRPVRIVCWNKLDDRPVAKEQKIVALVKNGCKENVFMYNNNGDGCISALDLFFADKEEELTEFETRIYSLINFSDPDNFPSIKEVKEEAEICLDLVRNEIEKDNIIIDKDKYLKICDQYYNNGKKDALKSLPKWKKANVFVSDEFGLATRDDDLIITNAGYQIKLSDLKTLPKEE